MRLHLLYLLLFFSTLTNAQESSAKTIRFRDEKGAFLIGNQIQLLEDESTVQTIQDVTNSKLFTNSNQLVPNLGVSNSAFWIKFTVQNESQRSSLLLELANPTIDELTLYTLLPNGEYNSQIKGSHFPVSAKKYQQPNYIFDINIAKNTTATFYLRIKSGKQMELPLTLTTTDFIFESNYSNEITFGVYFGIIVLTVFYNLFLYFSVKDKNYLYYIAYVTFVGLTQACLRGYTTIYLWPNNSWLITYSIFLIVPLSGLGAIGFANNFMLTKKHTPIARKVSFILMGLYILSLLLGITGLQTIASNIIDFTALLLSIYLLFVAIKISIIGYRPAKFFLFAWSTFLICIVLYVMRHQGVLPINSFTNYILEIGSAIEVTLLSFALADRINTMKKEKEASQQQTLLALEENKKIITQQNVLLELKVKERTNELERSNKELKETQTQLVNVEKMASLGQLTAGIAHEINNPINFVISNVKPLKRDVNDLLKLLTKYDELKDNENFEDKLNEIEALKQQLDAPYLVEEVGLLLKGIDEGASRTAEIVKGLQNFSRLDEEGFKKANVHEGINSTLLILNNDIAKEKIKISKEFDPNLPLVECAPGKINQVFLNLINNAVQATASVPSSERERAITIKTSTIDNSILISIKDNGKGIPEANKSKIFDLFFTTKEVGSGTGLGLSIVYGIIQSHQGEIKVESEENKGTEFIVKLPLSMPR